MEHNAEERHKSLVSARLLLVKNFLNVVFGGHVKR